MRKSPETIKVREIPGADNPKIDTPDDTNRLAELLTEIIRERVRSNTLIVTNGTITTKQDPSD